MCLYVSIWARIEPQPSYETCVTVRVAHTRTDKHTHTSFFFFYLGFKREGRRTFHSHTRRVKLASHEVQCFHPRRGRDVASFTVEWEWPGASRLSSKCPTPLPPTTSPLGSLNLSHPSLLPEGSGVAFTPDAHAAVTNLCDLPNTGKQWPCRIGPSPLTPDTCSESEAERGKKEEKYVRRKRPQFGLH